MVKNSMDSSLGVSLTVSVVCCPVEAVSYTHLTLPTTVIV